MAKKLDEYNYAEIHAKACELMKTRKHLKRSAVEEYMKFFETKRAHSKAVSEAAKEYPVLVGEYNPYFRSGVLSELTAEETAFLQKIFHWITANGRWIFSARVWKKLFYLFIIPILCAGQTSRLNLFVPFVGYSHCMRINMYL